MGFNFDMLLDLVESLPPRESSKNLIDVVSLWSVLIALVGENANKKTFLTRGQTIGISHIKILLQKLPDKSNFDPEAWSQI